MEAATARLSRLASLAPPDSHRTRPGARAGSGGAHRGLVIALLAALAALAPVLAGGASRAAAAEPGLRIYVGTYTGAKSKGIYALRLDPETGTAGPAELAAEASSPSFLAIHPGRRFLYAVNESGGSGIRGGAVSAYAVDAETGKLALLDQESSGGEGPCHIVIDSAGRNALVANYGSGSIAVLPIAEDGRLAPATARIQHEGSSVDPGRQKGPHAHSINLDAANRFAYAADLGLDKVLIYRFDPSRGTLAPADPPAARVKPGAGPRHFAFHPDGRHAYVINELDSTITAFACDPRRGDLKEVGTVSTLPPDAGVRNSTAEVAVHPAGRFVYGSNRGHDSIAVFAVKPDTGALERIENRPTGGKTPRNFGIDPSGRWLLAANQASDTITVFRIDAAKGTLTPAGEPIAVPTPVCVKFVSRP